MAFFAIYNTHMRQWLYHAWFYGLYHPFLQLCVRRLALVGTQPSNTTTKARSSRIIPAQEAVRILWTLSKILPRQHPLRRINQKRPKRNFETACILAAFYFKKLDAVTVSLKWCLSDYCEWQKNLYIFEVGEMLILYLEADVLWLFSLVPNEYMHYWMTVTSWICCWFMNSVSMYEGISLTVGSVLTRKTCWFVSISC